VNYAFFRDTGALSAQLLAGLAPWCDAIRSLPRTFVAGLPPDEVFVSALGPGLRVTCRDTVSRVFFLADFTPADAGAEFGVLRYERGEGRFVLERADRRVRVLVGEGFLIHARYDVACACFEAAARESLDRELSYPLVAALAAAGRNGEARARWSEAARGGRTLDPATMAARLGAIGSAGSPDTLDPRALVPLAATALRAPWEAEPHRALGAALLAGGRARQATFELAVAAGISRQNADLARLAQGYQAMGLVDEAIAAYRQALSAGLPRPLYEETRDRLIALMRAVGTSLDRSVTRP
jgi:tetratricopeptide (TPR) repeat protein